MLNTTDKKIALAVARALGDELRQQRERLDLSQERLVQRLPSKIGARTLLQYEHGTRQVTVLRLIELSEGLEIGAPEVLHRTLQQVDLEMAHMPVRVDLRMLLENVSPQILPLHQWAKNRMRNSDVAVVMVSPTGVQELAAAVGYPPQAVAQHLAKFLPADPYGT